MTTPWKSQGRKYCEFCDCWFADNKVSISFHENGKRHKESVEKKVKEIQRKGSEREKKERDEKNFLEMMEKGAAAAVEKDIKQDPRMIGHYFGDDVADIAPLPARSDSDDDPPPIQGPTLPPPNKKQKQSHEEEGPSVKSDPSRFWYEALSPEGYTYYWNIETNASVWVAPPEGYVPLHEQQQQQQQSADGVVSATGQSTTQQYHHQTDAVKTETKPAVKSEGGLKTETTFQRGHVDTKPEIKPKIETPKNEKTFGAGVVQRKSWKERAYGGWNAVKPEVDSTAGGVDLQLPKSTMEANLERDRLAAAAQQRESKDEIHFATKVVPSIGGASSSSSSSSSSKPSGIVFKKRKINTGVNSRVKEEGAG